MFERINTGSKIANNAEIRRGALAGPFMDMVAELAQLPVLIELAPMSAKTRRERGYEELVTRFFAYGDGLEGYRDRPADFIFSYSKKMNKEFEADPALADSYREVPPPGAAGRTSRRSPAPTARMQSPVSTGGSSL
ncbi:hypothetical protein [Actinomyces wuliandei]|uniref:hypothetical protein n=1 Tax=Actinomyces wuliandei TaxID=2057743 RepID=UPI0019D4664A|nr:hypothetical protein [Actinomyces wuliandei]